MADFNKCMAEEFDSSKTYSIGELVTYNKMLYRCTNQDYTAQEFSLENFEQTYLSDVLGMGNIIDDNIAPKYDSTLTYEIGNYVMYNRELYICNTKIETGEDFDSSKWDKCYISDMIGGEFFINSNLSSESDVLVGTTTSEKNVCYCTYNKQKTSAYMLEIPLNKQPKYIIISNKMQAFEETDTTQSIEYEFTFVDVRRSRIDHWSKVSSTYGSVNSYSFVIDGDACYVTDLSAKIAMSTSGTKYYRLIY